MPEDAASPEGATPEVDPKSQPSRVLVTGASGFIGGAVVDALVRAGRTPRAFVRRPESAQALRDRHGDRVGVVVGDLETGKGLSELIRGLDGPVPLVHAAGRSSTKAGATGAAAYTSIHTTGTGNLFDVCGPRLSQVVLIGSTDVFGFPDDQPVTEDHPVSPASDYARAKVAEEELAIQRCQALGIGLVRLRPSHVFGPGDPHLHRPPASYAEDVLAGRPLRIEIRGECRTQLVYVDDLADAAVRSLDSDYDGPLIVADSVSVTVAEMADVLAQVAGSDSGIEAADSPYDIPDASYDVSRAREVLGWEASTDLRTGLVAQMAATRTRGPLPETAATAQARAHPSALRRAIRRFKRWLRADGGS